MVDFMNNQKQGWVLDQLAKYKIPAAPILVPLRTMEHPQTLAREMVIEIDDANIGKYKAFGHPIKFSKTPCFVKKSSPKLGESTYDILTSLGYSEQEIQNYVDEEIVSVPEEH